MPKLSLNQASEQAGRFFRRETVLVLPVAFATFGLGALLLALVTPAAPANGQPPLGPWLLAFIPVVLAGLIGQFAIALLVLRPGISVGEALRGALAALPRALLVLLLLWVAAVVLLVGAMIVLGLIAIASGVNATSLTVATAILVFVMLLGVAGRMLLIWPMLADREAGAVATVRAAFALGKGGTARLIVALLAFLLVYSVVTGAARFLFGSVLLLIGRLTGGEGPAAFFAALLVALIAAALQALWAVFVTLLYRDADAAATGS